MCLPVFFIIETKIKVLGVGDVGEATFCKLAPPHKAFQGYKDDCS